jgi:20S proteasome subunit beta 3
MTGYNCVAIASDTRYGIQQQTISSDFQRIYSINSKTYVALPGLATDVQTVVNKLKYRNKLYELREDREIRPRVFGSLVSSMLYEKRFGPFFVEPMIAGLERREDWEKDELLNTSQSNKSNSNVNNKEEKQSEYVPFICAMDLIGAPVYTNDFLVGGTANEQLYGVCEAMYKPNMDPEQLFETVSQCLLAAVDRDCLSGW